MRPALVEPGPELTKAQLHRYARHLLLPTIGDLGQRRLLNARVAVLGAGGLGSPALLYLAAAGVGHLTIIDDDDVDTTNLQRQVLHDSTGVGSPKVESASYRVRSLNPDVQVVTRRTRLDADNAERLLAGHDLVLDGTDNFETRYVTADACERLEIPYVWASLFRTQAQLSVFRRPGPDGSAGVGLRDVFPTPPDAADVPSCADAGVLGSLCGQVGSMMATEAIKLICGVGTSLHGRLVFIDALDVTQREILVRSSYAAPTSGDAPTRSFPWHSGADAAPASGSSGPEVPLITPQRLEGLLAAPETTPLVLDVREPGEWQMGTIAGAQLTALGDLLAGADVPTDRPIVVTCKSGPRALRAAAELSARGVQDVSVLAGGMVAWTAEIDPSLVPY